MKKGIFFILLICSIYSQAQSLKDMLYSGKLKNTPAVIRKGDDLSAKIDTTRRADTLRTTGSIASADAPINKFPTVADPTAVSASQAKQSNSVQSTNDSNAASATSNVAPASAVNAPKETTLASKDNNVLWKAYIDSVNIALKSEVLNSKKIKKGSYFATVSYTIGTDGQVEVSDVFVSPENSFLQQQIKERLTMTAPRLNPVLSSSGSPRKASKRYNFTLSKD